MLVGVFGKDGQTLMPTDRLRAVRKMLKSGEAKIYSRRPFAIQLTYDCPNQTQAAELCADIGYQYLGESIKTAVRELGSMEFELLKGEKNRLDDRRMYRRTRRGRLRYREPRFDNRTRPKGWLAPSILHKMEAQIEVLRRLAKILPIKKMTIEVGKFDPALLSAMERGAPPPQGVGYQRGPQYYSDSLRAAVFERDNYTCRICGASLFKKGEGSNKTSRLHTHHALYWQGRHADTLGELITVCTSCHTAKNHRPGGKLWGLIPKVPRLEGATFMNQIRIRLLKQLRKELGPAVHVEPTYGAETSRRRKTWGIEKSHVNDAYCMGDFHPGVRAETEYYVKIRRNDRSLEAFYDAKIIDQRTGDVVSGKDLSCGRTNRRDSRRGVNNLRIYRGKTVKKGWRRITRQHYSIRAGDTIKWKGRTFESGSIHNGGTNVKFAKKVRNQKSAKPEDVQIICHVGGWKRIWKK